MSTQLEWENYAVDIAGEWDLCANCEPALAGKKLFRQLNFNRVLIGLPIVLSPPNPGAFSIAALLTFDFNNLVPLPYCTVDANLDPTLVGFSAVQMGKVLGNPSTTFNLVDITGFKFPGDKMYDFGVILASQLGLWAAVGDNSKTVSCCNSDDDGTPGRKSMLTVRVRNP